MRAPSSTARLAPEAEILLAAGSVAQEERRLARVREAAALGPDWSFIVRTANKNRILPLFRDAVRAAEVQGIPAEDAAELERLFKFYQFHNLRLLQLLREILSAFAEQGIAASPYKGPALALTLYEDLGLRQFYDLDLLVRPADLARARQVLERLGWRTSAAEATRRHLERDCEAHFITHDGVLVELHWQILPTHNRSGFQMDDFWERFVPLRLGESEVRVLSPEDLFLVLCLHGGEKHRWMRLQMIADVARIVTIHRDFEWATLLERARLFSRERTVMLGAYLAWLLLDAELPLEIVDSIARQRWARTRAALVVGRMLRPDSGLTNHRQWGANLEALEARSAQRGVPLQDSLGFRHYLGAVLEPESRDSKTFPLPESLTFLHWVLRPMRLAGKHGLGLLRRL